MMDARVRLPNCRELETVSLAFEGHEYAVSIGFDDNDQVREVFVTGQRQGSTLDDAARNSSSMVSFSIALTSVSTSSVSCRHS